jgi:hypothetical protein
MPARAGDPAFVSAQFSRGEIMSQRDLSSRTQRIRRNQRPGICIYFFTTSPLQVTRLALKFYFAPKHLRPVNTTNEKPSLLSY